MTKAFQALLSGLFFTFILDFFIFLGIKLHYIDANAIEVYFNTLFADHQSFFLFFGATFLLGYLVVYIESFMPKLILLGALFLVVLSTLIPPVGHSAGELLLMQKDATLKDKKHVYRGDILYNGRKDIVFFDKEINKKIILKKENLIQ
ncbi:MAG: hypothetical protein IE916_01705 [Epsilonproteobacteria bacterium]|nr:hypothetical protein [Campylobacterota bacterium]